MTPYPNKKKIHKKYPPHRWDRHCHRKTHDWKSVTLLFQYSTMCAYAKFSHLRNRILNVFKCYPTKLSKQLYNIIMTLYTACLHNDIQC